MRETGVPSTTENKKDWQFFIPTGSPQHKPRFRVRNEDLRAVERP